MRKVVFASHGRFASGLKDALSLITGDLAVEIITYDLLAGQSADDFALEISDLSKDNDIDEIIVLTDLKGASVCNAFTLIANNPIIHVFSGMNLAIALDVLLCYPNKLTTSNINQIIETGRASISYIEVIESESEEF